MKRQVKEVRCCSRATLSLLWLEGTQRKRDQRSIAQNQIRWWHGRVSVSVNQVQFAGAVDPHLRIQGMKPIPKATELASTDQLNG